MNESVLGKNFKCKCGNDGMYLSDRYKVYCDKCYDPCVLCGELKYKTKYCHYHSHIIAGYRLKKIQYLTGNVHVEKIHCKQNYQRSYQVGNKWYIPYMNAVIDKSKIYYLDTGKFDKKPNPILLHHNARIKIEYRKDGFYINNIPVDIPADILSDDTIQYIIYHNDKLYFMSDFGFSFIFKYQNLLNFTFKQIDVFKQKILVISAVNLFKKLHYHVAVQIINKI